MRKGRWAEQKTGDGKYREMRKRDDSDENTF